RHVLLDLQPPGGPIELELEGEGGRHQRRVAVWGVPTCCFTGDLGERETTVASPETGVPSPPRLRRAGANGWRGPANADRFRAIVDLAGVVRRVVRPRSLMNILRGALGSIAVVIASTALMSCASGASTGTPEHLGADASAPGEGGGGGDGAGTTIEAGEE